MSEALTINLDHLIELVKVSRELVDSVSFDLNGNLVGGKWMGGHGGLISSETLKACDRLRKANSNLEFILELSK